MRNGNNNIGYQVENLIAKDEIEKAIRLLIESLEQSEKKELYRKSLRTAESYVEIRRHQRLNTVHQDFAAIRISRIIDKFLQINMEAFGSNGINEIDESAPLATPKNSWVNKVFTRIKSIF